MTTLKTLTVYLGSSGRARTPFNDAAIRLGRLIGENGARLVYGGMDAGLMGLLAENALAAGAHVTGIIPQNLKDSERILSGLSETILTGDLWERKKRMFQAADDVVALPGGFGTLDESLEILFWAHLGLHQKPLAIVNVEGYWSSVLEFLKPLPDFAAGFLIVADRVEDVFAKLAAWTPPPALIKLPENFPHFETEIVRDTAEPIIIDKASVENGYYAATALGLKQLGKHARPIGFLNAGGQFDHLLKWFLQAERESFITPKCLQLYSAAESRESLDALLKSQTPVEINLHKDKWGERRKFRSKD